MPLVRIDCGLGWWLAGALQQSVQLADQERLRQRPISRSLLPWAMRRLV
jgi:hypothetical protein